MYSLVKLLALSSALASSSVVNALRESAPLLAWSPSTKPMHGLLTQEIPVSEWPVFNHDVQDSGLCQFDVVMFVSHPGMNANDLRGMRQSSALYKRLSTSAQNVTVVGLPTASLPPISSSAESLASRCGADFLEYGESSFSGLPPTKKVVLHVIMSPLTGYGQWRKESYNNHVSRLDELIRSVEEVSFNHAILYSSSPLPQHLKRQTDATSLKQSLPEPFSFAAAKPTSTGIFARYQLLTPGLITALLAVFFVIVPLIVFAVNALASIQSSVRLDAPKVVSQERKSQ